MEYNVYGDESCHLEHDIFDKMFLGCIRCEKSKAKHHNESIRNIKINNKLSHSYELKWTKVSQSKIDFYNELIDYFSNSNDLCFRCVIANDKKELDNIRYSQTYDDWYYKMYYTLLKYIMDNNQYNIYIDKKDTYGSEKINQLKKILSHTNWHINTLKKIQLVNSEEIELIQLCDFFLGAISYYNRYSTSNMSAIKKEICNTISIKFDIKLNTTNNNTKFNIFVWNKQ